ncbi:MAG: IS1380 family transposase [Mycobacterium sp.]
MQLSHIRPVSAAVFDDPKLVSCAGLVPMAALAQQCGLARLADEHLSVPTDKGAHAGAKVSCLVAGMVAGADSIDDMALLRHGAMGTVFDRPYAPSTLGSFLREFAFGHVRQLDAVASCLLVGLASDTPVAAGIDGPVCVDVDDTIIEVHGYAKQGSGYGYSGVRGLNALIATVTTAGGAPVITGQRLRNGSCGSPRGAARMIGDTLATVKRLRSPQATTKPLVRMDSAFYGYPSVAAAIRGDPRWCRRVGHRASGPQGQSRYRRHRRGRLDGDRLHRRHLRRHHRSVISRAEVAEIGSPHSAPAKPPSRSTAGLVVRRIPDLNPTTNGQATLFDTWRFHAFFTTTDSDTVSADKIHRGHAIIEQVHADLKDSALAYLPVGAIRRQRRLAGPGRHRVQLTPAAATLTGPAMGKARTATIRRTLISVPARIAPSARRLRLHLPRGWPWETAWNTLFDSLFRRNQPIIA